MAELPIATQCGTGAPAAGAGRLVTSACLCGVQARPMCPHARAVIGGRAFGRQGGRQPSGPRCCRTWACRRSGSSWLGSRSSATWSTRPHGGQGGAGAGGVATGRPDPRVEFSIERREGKRANPEDGQVLGQVVGEGSAVEKDAARPASRAGDWRRLLMELWSVPRPEPTASSAPMPAIAVG